MTRMIPPTIHSSVKSDAERRIFKRIALAEGTESWICLHSLGLAKHQTKRRGEIDFLLLCPDGIFVLEVKGGGVRRSEGVWIHTNRFGETTQKRESPFDQASSAMFALENDLARAPADISTSKLMFGYGVLFPDLEYPAIGADEDPALVYDARDARRPFGDYARRLSQFTRSRQKQKRRGLAPGEIQKICEVLRGDFDLQPLRDLELDETRQSIAELTMEQRSVLDSAEFAARVLIDGPAGSGKTILAMEEARREARKGRRVLFLCFNRLLAAQVRGDLRVEKYAGKIDVETLAAHCNRWVAKSAYAEQFESEAEGVSDEERYKVLLPEYAAMAAMEVLIAPYECVVIDEAQDIISRGLTDLISAELLDGFEHGRWRVFLDSNNQASVYGALDPKELQRFADAAEKRPDLVLNCRNTKQIAIQTNVVSQPNNRAAGLVSGVAVEFRIYSTETDGESELEKLVAELNSQGMVPGRASILFARRPNGGLVRKLGVLGVAPLEESEVGNLGTARLGTFTWSTVSAFKGLENDVVVLAGIKDIEKDWWRAVTYVGMSRARVQLYVVVHSKCDALRKKRFEAELQRRLQTKEMIS